LASGSAGILIPMDTRIRTGAAIHIATGIIIMGRASTSDPHFTGITAIEFTTRDTIDTIITAVGNKLRGQEIFEGRRVKSPAGFYFFGDEEPAGADVDAPEGDGS
jgi:hypothetical protein